MVQKVGLLPPYNHSQIPFAWAMYTRDDKDGLLNSEAFKKTFSADVIIDFVGVWYVFSIPENLCLLIYFPGIL